MKQVIKKTKLFSIWQFEEEEQWLNEMAAQGFCLVDISFARYTFELTLPGTYQIRKLFLTKDRRSPEWQHYLSFLQTIGVEPVTWTGNWVYLRKKSGGKPFEVYSDTASKLYHLQQIYKTLWLTPLSFSLIIPSSLMRLLIYNAYEHPILFALNLLLLLSSLALFIVSLKPLHELRKKIKQLKDKQQIYE